VALWIYRARFSACGPARCSRIFEAPRIINPDPRFAARDLAVVSTQDGSVLAALDAKSSSLSFYSRQSGGPFTRQAGPQVPGKLPVAIRSGDLSGDGQLDSSWQQRINQVFVYLQSAAGTARRCGFRACEPDLRSTWE
jgi:hypothetical protein